VDDEHNVNKGKYAAIKPYTFFNEWLALASPHSSETIPLDSSSHLFNVNALQRSKPRTVLGWQGIVVISGNIMVVI